MRDNVNNRSWNEISSEEKLLLSVSKFGPIYVVETCYADRSSQYTSLRK